MASRVILPICYFPPIGWWVEAMNHQEVYLDPFEFHIKQSYRSRCKIYAVNGVQTLSVVTDNKGSKCPMNEATLVDYEPWRKVHLKALESSYYSSPYFEFYQEELERIINSKTTSLTDLNLSSIQWINQKLDLNIQFNKTSKFESSFDGTDQRPGKKNEFINLESLPPYNQVFMDKGKIFEANLSILDLLFNAGMESRIYLNALKHRSAKLE